MRQKYYKGVLPTPTPKKSYGVKRTYTGMDYICTRMYKI